ncbi:MAG: hypothetical protein R6V47_07665 [Candidatus Delongbacteria bacterium]
MSGIETEHLEQEELESLTDHFSVYPLNINRATPHDIYQLPYIDEITAELIYRRIESEGEINSLGVLAEENILSEEYLIYLKVILRFILRTGA